MVIQLRGMRRIKVNVPRHRKEVFHRHSLYIYGKCFIPSFLPSCNVVETLNVT